MKAIRSPSAELATALLACFAIALAGCVPAARPPVTSLAPRQLRPLPRPASVAAPQTDWRDAPQTAGDWTWSDAAGGSAAFFGSVLAIRCDRTSGTIVFERTGSPVRASTMTVFTTELARTVAAAPGGGMATARLSASDPLLDAMAFSRGRFAVAAPGTQTIYVPSWPELGRVVEDCR